MLLFRQITSSLVVCRTFPKSVSSLIGTGENPMKTTQGVDVFRLNQVANWIQLN